MKNFDFFKITSEFIGSETGDAAQLLKTQYVNYMLYKWSKDTAVTDWPAYNNKKFQIYTIPMESMPIQYYRDTTTTYNEAKPEFGPFDYESGNAPIRRRVIRRNSVIKHSYVPGWLHTQASAGLFHDPSKNITFMMWCKNQGCKRTPTVFVGRPSANDVVLDKDDPDQHISYVMTYNIDVYYKFVFSGLNKCSNV